MTVFSFRIFHTTKDNQIDDINEVQYRYVVASTEEEAIEKIDAHRIEMINNGFSNFIFNDPTVEIDSVII